MANIATSLQADKKRLHERVNTDEAVKQVKLLENNAAAEDIRLATALGSKNSISRQQTRKGALMHLENLDKQYVGNVFTLEQIKRLAMLYDMRFLQSRHYCGEIDLGVITKLKQFSAETGTEITDGNLQHNFYILAPEKCFNLKRIEKVKRVPDPALFYKIDETHYRLIHQWGTDFNIFNRIAGLNWKNRRSKFWVHQFTMVLPVILLAYLLNNLFNLKGEERAFIPIILTVVMTVRNLINAYSEGVWRDGNFHKWKWQSTDRLE